MQKQRYYNQDHGQKSKKKTLKGPKYFDLSTIA